MYMTIDEAIEQARKKADKNSGCWKHCASIKNCNECETENKQLAEWLEELKSYRVSVFSGDMTQKMLKEQYNKAIDDFLEKIQWEYLNSCGIEQKEIEFLIAVSSQVAEQLTTGEE